MESPNFQAVRPMLSEGVMRSEGRAIAEVVARRVGRDDPSKVALEGALIVGEPLLEREGGSPEADHLRGRSLHTER